MKPDSPLPRDRWLIAAVVVAMAGLALLVSRPWWPDIAWLGRDSAWLTLRDGQTALQVVRDADGAPIRWTSTNVYHVPMRHVLAGGAGQPAASALEASYPGALAAGDIRGAQVYQLRNRHRDAAGQIGEDIVWLLQDAAGTRLFDYTQTANRLNLGYTPPYPVYPPTPQAGARWHATGQRSDGVLYEVTGQVTERGPFHSSLGDLDDCVRMAVQNVLTTTVPAGAIATTTVSWECPTLGAVTWETFDADGNLTERGQILASSVTPPATGDLGLPRAATPPVTATLSSPNTWRFSRVGRVWPLYRNGAGSATFAPVFVPRDPPLLLAGVIGGALTALDAATGDERWQFSAGGTVYSPPTVDLLHDSVYFGSSAKMLYALDLDGFFRWAFPTRDNIATKPLLVDELVVFGSEDRSLYALDAMTGILRWQFDTGSPIAASPDAYTRTGDSSLVIFGSDDGGIYALDAAEGQVIWEAAAEDAVEAPIVVSGNSAYVASRDGNLYALDAATGAEQWTAAVDEVMRLAPAVGRDRLYVVSQFGDLHVIDRQTGLVRHTLDDVTYGASPLILRFPDDIEAVLAPRYAAGADLLDTAGQPIQTWDASVARLAGDNAQPSYVHPASAGGGAFWFADDGGVVYRLGPPLTLDGGMDAQLDWLLPAGIFPFAGEILYTSPLVVDDSLMIMDMVGTLYRIDAVAGKASLVGQPATGQQLRAVEPIAAGDTILASFDDLVALDAATAAVRWQVAGNRQHVYPPVVSGDTVLWFTTAAAEGIAGSGDLVALGLDDGSERWRVAVDEQPFFGGVAAGDSVVVTAAPLAAYDLSSGAERWRGPADIVGLGVPALAGDLAFVGTYDLERSTGAIRGLDAATGLERWAAELPGDDALSLLGRIWVSGESVVVQTYGGALYAFETAGGAQRWERRFSSVPVGSITVADGRVYALLDNGDLVVLDAVTGAELARARSEQHGLQELVWSQRPVVLDDRVVAATGLSLLGFRITED